MNRLYNGIVFTNHAIDRMRERQVTQQMVWGTINSPDRSRYAQEKTAFIYNKTYGQNMVEVVASKNERKEWVVVSVWARPLERLKYTQDKYLYRNTWLDWILDKLLGRFKTKHK